MIQPVHDIVKRGTDGPRGHGGPVDHHHRQAKGTCGIQLGAGASTARILGHDHVDPVVLHQRPISGQPEWPTGYHNLNIGQRQRVFRRIDQPDQVMVLSLSCEGRKILFADGQKYAPWLLRQRVDRPGNIRDMLPAVTRPRLPGCAFERGQRNTGLGAGQHRVTAHLRGERVGGIHNPLDPLSPQVRRQPGRTAKAADTCRQRLRYRCGGSACVGKHRIVATFRQRARQIRGFAGAAQYKDAWHV